MPPNILTSEDLAFRIWMLSDDPLSTKVMDINLGRRMGHTTTICDFATKDDLVITRSPVQSMQMQRDSIVAKVVSVSYMYTARGLKPRYIFIDDWSQLKSHEKDQVMCEASALFPKLIIRLG